MLSNSLFVLVTKYRTKSKSDLDAAQPPGYSLLILLVTGFSVTSSPTGFPTLVSPDCYRTKSGECGEPLAQGDCGDGEWLVLGEGGVLVCQERVCPPGKVLIQGKCLAIVEDSTICSGLGKLKDNNNRLNQSQMNTLNRNV